SPPAQRGLRHNAGWDLRAFGYHMRLPPASMTQTRVHDDAAPTPSAARSHHPPHAHRLVALYRTMARIRAFENASEIASQGGVQAWGLKASDKPALVRGPLHLSTGQEAVAAGVCANLTREDLLTSTHRGHGHTLAKGADVD